MQLSVWLIQEVKLCMEVHPVTLLQSMRLGLIYHKWYYAVWYIIMNATNATHSNDYREKSYQK